MRKRIFLVVLVFILGLTCYADQTLKIETDIDNKVYVLKKIPDWAIVTLYSDKEKTTELAKDYFYYKPGIGQAAYKAEIVLKFNPELDKGADSSPVWSWPMAATRFTFDFTKTENLTTSIHPWYTVSFYNCNGMQDLPIALVAQDNWENFCAKIGGTPTGTIIPWATKDIPEGFLPADGSIVAINKYPRLFAAIGNNYGGDGISNFGLPDLRGLFIRGVGGNSAALGIIQGDAIRNITGSFDCTANGPKTTGCFKGGADKIPDWHANQNGPDCTARIFDASLVVPTANENRPVNIALNYIIKFL